MKPSELICKRFAFSQAELDNYAQTCPYRYKTYQIEKRSTGFRTISQPSKDLKVVQRFMLEKFLNPKLIVHDAAKAYKTDTNILDNAKPHLKNSYILKMDFEDFFPSITAKDFVNYLISSNIAEENYESELLAKIFFMNKNGELRLSIGSPGSPIISNALLKDFDKVIFDQCVKEGIAYTRYSDDITLSTNHQDILFAWPEKVKAYLLTMNSPKLKLNEEKTIFSSKKFNRHVTGITITNDGKPSIGRGRKRTLRSRVFHAANCSEKELANLRGHIAFATQVDAHFLVSLNKKYPEQMAIIMNSGR